MINLPGGGSFCLGVLGLTRDVTRDVTRDGLNLLSEHKVMFFINKFSPSLSFSERRCFDLFLCFFN